MRVISGTARSLPLKCPDGLNTRPTTDRIKETLFNMLQVNIPGCIFLDIFSGSGGIGIEALSRGASKAYFIENNPTAIGCIQDNLQFTKFTEKAILLRQDAVSALNNICENEIDIVFIDPPYGQELEKNVLSAIKEYRYITSDTLFIVESDLTTNFSYLPSLGYSILKEKNYKTSRHLFLQLAE
ncbi:MAG TPA: 16S rRNA (guanine(966)-N(2))-methyltransferase RsmD [Lachnospiraceae bacterium]|nr:16S rRNA (guanine(966)-N(2))-methyltransferase RsmD [Lachnospiraceae bacterium]